jgi:fructan beta-fructosidase
MLKSLNRIFSWANNKLYLTKPFFLLAFLIINENAQGQLSPFGEQYRPQLHFSPAKHWINDPNGMVYYKGQYHLFFQYYPNGITWGPMHWGHAVSTDLVHWLEKPIALFPDSLGYIFSGSIVIDSQNLSDFGKEGKVPFVAVFTQHDPVGEKNGRTDFQVQSLAYSLDEGNTWLKYTGDPIIKNPGMRDFRDPKLIWYAPLQKWVMTLAVKDHVAFYSSKDLKNWTAESDFGRCLGNHGGVWECPDLFPLTYKGKTYWILIANINPGGPNGGSATQYFIGTFDGHNFHALEKDEKWLDYGPDEYAGVTWNNTGKQRIFLGWMSNWTYANQVPTLEWRNAMTIPRTLSLKVENGKMLLVSEPTLNLERLAIKRFQLKCNEPQALPAQSLLELNLNTVVDYKIELYNEDGKKLIIGYDIKSGRYFIDRTNSGNISFNPSFGRISYAPRLSTNKLSNIKVLIDASSVELFADGGLTTMTSICFPNKPYNKFILKTDKNVIANGSQIISLAAIWK